MLRITASQSPASAKSYYPRDDYYGAGGSVIGKWIGQGSKLLGLSGTVKGKDFQSLCDNLHPATGARITVKTRKDRRPGYDATYDVPKSLSVLHALCGDARILDAMGRAIEETISEMETEMHVRVRVGGADFDRRSSNLVAAPFTHFTARPVDGYADPHLHQHVFMLNMTYDESEKKWKAGQFGRVKERAPYYQALYHGKLVSAVAEIGYRLVLQDGKLEVEGFPASAIRKFSRRTEEIDELAEEHGINDPEQKAALGAKSRQSKKGGLQGPELLAKWKSILSVDELEKIEAIAHRAEEGAVSVEQDSPHEVVGYATRHLFERASVVKLHDFLACALEHAPGRVTIEDLQATLQRTSEIIAEDKDGDRWVTTTSVLHEEYQNIQFVKGTRGTLAPINAEPDLSEADTLSLEQAGAVEHILTSADHVIGISGGPGTGKTTLMKAAVEAINRAGLEVYTFAPSADASRGVLRSEGFEDADTLQQLLLNPAIQAKVAGQVVWLDEAGLVGTTHLRKLFSLSEKLKFRVILGGDTTQHSPVPRGDALRILEDHAGLKHVRVRTVRRQKVEQYRQAVEHISSRRLKKGFHLLDGMGWIREIPDETRHLALADEFVVSSSEGRSALIVVPTHSEGRKISRAVRRKLKDAGLLGSEEVYLARLKNNGWTEAQRSVSGNYQVGLMVQFHQNSCGNTFSRGERATVLSVGKDHVMVRSSSDDLAKKLSLAEAAKFTVYDRDPLPVAAGERLRITANGKARDGLRLNNGAIYQVKEVLADGDLQMTNGIIVSHDFGHFTYGYCWTSASSQGKTVDHVLVGQSAESLGRASSLEQFNVSVSRAKFKATIFTDDKTTLLRAVSKSSARLSAHDVIAPHRRCSLLKRATLRHSALIRTAALRVKASSRSPIVPFLPEFEPDLTV